LMEGVPMREIVGELSVASGGIPVVSAISGAPYGEDVREIWIRHATAPVDFISALRAAGARVWLQVGAGNVLTSFVKATLPDQERLVGVSLAGRDEDGLLQLAVALGQIWSAGVG